MVSCFPPPPACHTSPSCSPLLRPPVFGWLLHGCLLIGGRLKATVYFIKKIRPSICCSKQYSHVPPRAPQPACLLICRRSQLLVDCCVSLLIGGHLRPMPCLPLFFWWGLHWLPKQGNQPWRWQTQLHTPWASLWEAAEPWVDGTAALPMEQMPYFWCPRSVAT